MYEEIDLELEKGTNERFTIYLDDEVTYRQLNRIVKTKDRWIRLATRRFRGTTKRIDIQIITRGLWGGYHRGILRISTPKAEQEYVINLMVHPKKRHSVFADCEN